MRSFHFLLVLAGCLAPLWGTAQVVKCTDPVTGQISYTDDKCAVGAAGQHLLDKPSAAELARQEAEAWHAQAALAAARAREPSARPAPVWQASAGVAPAAATCAQARSNLEAASNYKYVTPQASANLVAQAQQRADAACREPAPRVHVVRRTVVVRR